jgi:hypothetical protein
MGLRSENFNITVFWDVLLYSMVACTNVFEKSGAFVFRIERGVSAKR